MTTTPRLPNAAKHPPDALLQLLAQLPRGPARGDLIQTLTLGKHVLDWLYDGDLAAFEEAGKSQPTVRVLVSGLDLGLSPVSLHRAVSIYGLSRQLGSLSRWTPLGITHFRSVLGLCRAAQIELLDCALAQGWSVRRLETESAQRRRGETDRRRPAPRFPRTVRRLQRQTTQTALDGIEEMNGCDEELLRPTLESVSGLLARLDRLEMTLRSRVTAPAFRPVCLGAPELGMEPVKIGA